MMTKLEMPVSGTGSNSATAALLASGGAPTTSQMITSTGVPMKSDDPLLSPKSPSTTITTATGATVTVASGVAGSGATMLDPAATNTIFGAGPETAQDNGSIESDDLGPVPRDRCNTWPLRRTKIDLNSQTSPLIHEQILEEETE